MKISAQVAMWSSIVFAALCLWVAFSGFSSLDGMADETALADARGFAWFWLFLGAIAIAAGVASWLIVKGENANPSDRW